MKIQKKFFFWGGGGWVGFGGGVRVDVNERCEGSLMKL